MDEDELRALLLRLKHSLQALCISPTDQAALEPDLPADAVASELAEDFDNWAVAAVGQLDDRLTEEQSSSVLALSEKLGDYTPKDAFWSVEGLFYGDDWRRVRQMAAEVLALSNWPARTPSGYGKALAKQPDGEVPDLPEAVP